MTRALRARAFAAGLWLSLAIIFIHAVAPNATPWRVSYGSAFNGFTRDVSLGPARTAPVEKDQRARERRDESAGIAGDRLAPVALVPAPVAPVVAGSRPDVASMRASGLASFSIPDQHRARAPPLT